MSLPIRPALFVLLLSFTCAAPAAPGPPGGEPSVSGKLEGADAAWAEIEKVLRDPAERPKSRDEAMAMMKARITKLDEMSESFRKTYPGDPRRWRLATQMVETFQMREIVGLPPKSLDEVKAVLAEVLAAPDADPETKAIASFNTAIAASEELKTGKGTLAALENAAAAHVKAYPDFKGNQQLERMVAASKAETGFKDRPLEIKFTAVDGREVDMETLRGKVVLVDFWATWCGPCMEEVPNLLKVYEKFRENGFEIVGISFDQDKARLESVTKEKGMTWPQYFDGKGWQNAFAQKFGINSIPRLWLVNKKGMLVDTNGRADLAAKVEKLLAE